MCRCPNRGQPRLTTSERSARQLSMRFRRHGRACMNPDRAKNPSPRPPTGSLARGRNPEGPRAKPSRLCGLLLLGPRPVRAHRRPGLSGKGCPPRSSPFTKYKDPEPAALDQRGGVASGSRVLRCAFLRSKVAEVNVDLKEITRSWLLAPKCFRCNMRMFGATRKMVFD